MINRYGYERFFMGFPYRHFGKAAVTILRFTFKWHYRVQLGARSEVLGTGSSQVLQWIDVSTLLFND